MKRREFMAVLGSAVLLGARAAKAATSSRIFRLATVSPGLAIADKSPLGASLLNALAQHGYTVGQNLVYEALGAEGKSDELPKILQRMKDAKIDVVVCPGFPTALAAKASGIPTVIPYGEGDPVATGLVTSLAHPGGNLTGIADVAATVMAKRLSLLKAMVPGLQRVAILWNKDDPAMSLRYEAAKQAADASGITVQPQGLSTAEDFTPAFDTLTDDPPDAILTISDSLTTLNRDRILDYALARRIPAIYEYDFLVKEGGLMSYGADLEESFKRTAALVDQIFKGALPADLPFETPTHYPFAINLTTAASMGFQVPPAVLTLADLVIK
jgi:putative tryptophan/tyrosine transport system substrate-binding protein